LKRLSGAVEKDGVAVGGLYCGVHRGAKARDQVGAEFHEVAIICFRPVHGVGGVLYA